MTASRASTDPLALLPGTVLAEFCVRRVLGSGGFGIVYLARDASLHRDVAVKEYLPASLAGRLPDGHVVARSDDAAAAFRLGLKSFVNEARLLARFDHPALVKVHRFWEDRGTAYMAMPYYEGATLRQVRKSVGGPPDEVWLQRLLDGLLGALETLHRADVLHRDVAPDNILVLPGGAPLLLDFGAARHVLAEQPQVLTAMLKPTFAPIEQYAGAADLRQGPWTDLYATAATLHHCLTGEAPPAAAARTLDDRYRPLHQRSDLRQRDGQPYDARWLAALDWALEVLPQRRPQSVAQWRAVLDGRRPSPRAGKRVGAVTGPERTGLPDDFPATEVHARQWLPPSGTTVTSNTPTRTPGAQAVPAPAVPERLVPERVAPERVVPERVLPERLAPERVLPERLAPARAVPSRPSRIEPATGWRRPWVAGGALGLAGALALVSALQSGARTDRAVMPAGAPIAALSTPALPGQPTARRDGAAGVSIAAASPAAGAGPAESAFATASLPGPDEIHETAAEQGRVIRVAPRTFDTPVDATGTLAEDAQPTAQRRRNPARPRVAAMQTPRQFCGADDRGWFSRMVCMHRSCDLPKWREHAQCDNWRRPTEAQAQRLNGPS